MSHYYLRVDRNGEIVERIDSSSPLLERGSLVMEVEYEKYVLAGLYRGDLRYTMSRIEFLLEDISKLKE